MLRKDLSRVRDTAPILALPKQRPSPAECHFNSRAIILRWFVKARRRTKSQSWSRASIRLTWMRHLALSLTLQFTLENSRLSKRWASIRQSRNRVARQDQRRASRFKETSLQVMMKNHPSQTKSTVRSNIRSTTKLPKIFMPGSQRWKTLLLKFLPREI